MDIDLADRIAASADRFRTDPSAGQTHPSVIATLVNGHARLTSGQFNWEADLGPAVGGENLAPSPTAYLLGALAGCGVAFLRDTLAPLFGVAIDDVTATASCRSDLAGLIGIDGVTPALEALTLEIVVRSASADEQVSAMLDAWRERCPIYLALITATPVSLDLRVEAPSSA